MDDTAVESAAYTDLRTDVDSFADHARHRAETEREVVEWAMDELETLIDERDVDLEPLLEYGRRSRESLPDRHRRAYEAMAEVFDVDPEVYDVYVFAYSELCEELAEGEGRSEKHPKGCTNALVSTPKAETASVDGGDNNRVSDADTGGPMVLKNRDIAGRGLRPKSIVEQPAFEDTYGILTVDTCGTISMFKGVNDQGLVAANTFIDSERADVDPENQLRNGTVIRMILEECSTVGEARTLLESYPTRQLCGQTLFLADATDAVLLEVDPVAERITVDDDQVVTRTNHFVHARSTQTESSTKRRQRALELLEGDHRLDRDDLWRFAQDHENGPGDDSICRHPEPDVGEHAFGQLTTASTAIFEGGSATVDLGMGNPCETERTRCRFGEEIPMDLRTGDRWLDRLH
ncbi:C45 family autoproteolytic acyltransferase/hydolase [Natronolimnohabitans innermongolicus]|uniref:Peptidase C45 acyl-coenzyme A:6-aminopenicillanic acid acyl-transferase n=1 Tax=Natronolimnohabitans innermongolicus JCM 12255 TaxID=1227499 RepID=L9X256_9EURY|nr:C45 family peptidase [Natronolimnohabitans innermongolicus]ELY55854.1 peptidase C45 acyl-coenzyme A:6- aminopenicillanic acid acyl-transferase [Natronolimnohabitans innermongolicus JCM 12255]